MIDIGEVSRASGLTTATLRFYEREGLVSSVARQAGRRQYDSDVLTRLALIEVGRNSGFTLAEIKAILDSDVDDDVLNDLCRAKIAELDERIAAAELSKTYLEHTLRCPIRPPLACPTLQGLLKDVIPRRTDEQGEARDSEPVPSETRSGRAPANARRRY